MKRRLLRSALTLAAILILLALTTGYIVFGLYRTSSLLTESNRKAFALEASNKTAILTDYFRHRVGDLTELARMQVLQTYFERNTLALPVERGLDVIAGQIEEELVSRRLEIEDYGRQVYASGAFFDLETGKVIARTDHSPKGRWINEELFTSLLQEKGKDVDFGTTCHGQSCRLLAYAFVRHGEQQKGILLMELSAETILGKIQLLSLQRPNDFTGLTNSAGVLVLGPQGLTGKTMQALLRISPEFLGEPGQLATMATFDGEFQEPVAVAGNRIPGTGFSLMQIAPQSRFVGESSPLLLGMVFGSLMVGLVLMLAHVFRSYVERHLMFQRLQEAHDHLELRVKERTVELQRLNENLTLEVLERKRAEEALRLASQDLEAANKELKQFASIVSHDLKAPLRAASQLVSWLAADYEKVYDEQGKEYLGLLLARIKRMHGLIDGILAYSRVGRIREKLTDVDLNRLVRDVIELVGAPSHITVSVDSDLPTVRGEETRLHEVFQNLIDNAIKYMDKPHGEVSIRCLNDNSHWQFSISDTGPGIERQYFDKIFQIFQTLHSRDDVESAGIGLTLVKKIVELHGGRIWLTSEPGSGTTFFFTLPREGSNR